jgi:hypothetical protein
MTTPETAGVKHVVSAYAHIQKACEICAAWQRPSLADTINHYIQEHGYKLLHIGQHTVNDEPPAQSTVAYLGK